MRDNLHITSLQIASLLRVDDIIPLLLQRRADVTVVNKYGSTAYDLFLLSCGNVLILERFLRLNLYLFIFSRQFRAPLLAKILLRIRKLVNGKQEKNQNKKGAKYLERYQINKNFLLTLMLTGHVQIF